MNSSAMASGRAQRWRSKLASQISMACGKIPSFVMQHREISDGGSRRQTLGLDVRIWISVNISVQANLLLQKTKKKKKKTFFFIFGESNILYHLGQSQCEDQSQRQFYSPVWLGRWKSGRIYQIFVSLVYVWSEVKKLRNEKK